MSAVIFIPFNISYIYPRLALSVAQITDEMIDSCILKRTTLTTIPHRRIYKHGFTLLLFLFPRLESKRGPGLISEDTEQFTLGVSDEKTRSPTTRAPTSR